MFLNDLLSHLTSCLSLTEDQTEGRKNLKQAEQSISRKRNWDDFFVELQDFRLDFIIDCK